MFASGRGQKARKLLKESGLPQEEPKKASPEFSRPVTLEQLTGGRTVTLTPTDSELEKLSARFAVEAIPYFTSNITTTAVPSLKGCVKGKSLYNNEMCRDLTPGYLPVEGSFNAIVVQLCTITNTPFSSSLASKFSCVLVPSGDTEAIEKLTAEGSALPDIEEVVGGIADIGEVAAQVT